MLLLSVFAHLLAGSLGTFMLDRSSLHLLFWSLTFLVHEMTWSWDSSPLGRRGLLFDGDASRRYGNATRCVGLAGRARRTTGTSSSRCDGWGVPIVGKIVQPRFVAHFDVRVSVSRRASAEKEAEEVIRV